MARALSAFVSLRAELTAPAEFGGPVVIPQA
jgi:hypothetical protein